MPTLAPHPPIGFVVTLQATKRQLRRAAWPHDGHRLHEDPERKWASDLRARQEEVDDESQTTSDPVLASTEQLDFCTSACPTRPTRTAPHRLASRTKPDEVPNVDHPRQAQRSARVCKHPEGGIPISSRSIPRQTPLELTSDCSALFARKRAKSVLTMSETAAPLKQCGETRLVLYHLIAPRGTRSVGWRLGRFSAPSGALKGPLGNRGCRPQVTS